MIILSIIASYFFGLGATWAVLTKTESGSFSNEDEGVFIFLLVIWPITLLHIAGKNLMSKLIDLFQ